MPLLSSMLMLLFLRLFVPLVSLHISGFPLRQRVATWQI